MELLTIYQRWVGKNLSLYNSRHQSESTNSLKSFESSGGVLYSSTGNIRFQ